MIKFAQWISDHRLDFQPATNKRFIGLDMKYYTCEELYEEFIKLELDENI